MITNSDRVVSKQRDPLEDFARSSTRIALVQGWKSTEKLSLSDSVGTVSKSYLKVEVQPKMYLSESQKVSTFKRTRV